MNRDVVLPNLQLFIHAVRIAPFTYNGRDQQGKITTWPVFLTKPETHFLVDMIQERYASIELEVL